MDKILGKRQGVLQFSGHHDDVFDKSPEAEVLMERGMLWAAEENSMPKNTASPRTFREYGQDVLIEDAAVRRKKRGCMEKVRIGILGLGAISGIYLKNLTTVFKETQVLGIYDLIPGKWSRHRRNTDRTHLFQHG